MNLAFVLTQFYLFAVTNLGLRDQVLTEKK